MRFDWYQATIPAHPVDLVQSILSTLAPGGDVVEGRGKHNYHQSFTIRDVQEIGWPWCWRAGQTGTLTLWRLELLLMRSFRSSANGGQTIG